MISTIGLSAVAFGIGFMIGIWTAFCITQHDIKHTVEEKCKDCVHVSVRGNEYPCNVCSHFACLNACNISYWRSAT